MKSIVMAVLMLQIPVVPDPAPIKPSGKWTVEYGPSECILSRNYGTAPDQTIVGFKPAALGGSLEVVMLAPGARTAYRRGKATLTLLPSNRVIESVYTAYGLEKAGQTLTTINTDDDVSDELENAASVKLDFAKGGTQTVAVPGIKAAMAALETCQADLLKGWGVDPTERERYAGPPKKAYTLGVPARWITTDDYPASAVQARQQGRATALWKVGVDGRVKECRIVKSSGVAALDQATCAAIAKRGRYTPALDKQGKPMEFHSMRRVIWQLPD
ncbi:energy transducer TonB [Sphingomonas sp. MMS24-J45]|uniref:energy transducer TonB n=1 Tax=Sphingomonas sp. MMS24-J45 TaxID=3238806 RepID=UPI00384BC64F